MKWGNEKYPRPHFGELDLRRIQSLVKHEGEQLYSATVLLKLYVGQSGQFIIFKFFN